jgi:hypothetical protein
VKGHRQEWTEAPSHIGGAARGWAGVWGPRGPTPSPLRISGSFGGFLDDWLLFHPILRIFPV